MTTTGTEAVEFESVGRNRKAVFGRNFLLQTLDVTVFELHDLSAASANQMVMVALMGHIVVLGLGTKMSGLGEAGFAEQIERPVDSGEAKMRIFARQLMIHFFSGDVLLFEKGVEDQLTLPSKFQLMLPEMFLQNSHFFGVFRHGDQTLPPRSGIKDEIGLPVKSVRIKTMP